MMRDAAGDRRLRPGVPAPVGRPPRADQHGAGGPDGRRAGRRPDQLRDVAPGRSSGRTSRSSARRPGAAAPARPAGDADQQADGGRDLGRRTGCRGRRSRSPQPLRRAGGRDDHAGGHAERGRLRPRPRPRGVRGAAAGGASRRRLRSRAEILLNIQSYIEANLGDPDLDPDEIARASFISTRYLHKLFESEGTSVCRWIRISRLERCRRDLLDPALGHETILAIASRWGLPGPQHFSRLFRSSTAARPASSGARRARPARRPSRSGPASPVTAVLDGDAGSRSASAACTRSSTSTSRSARASSSA